MYNTNLSSALHKYDYAFIAYWAKEMQYFNRNRSHIQSAQTNQEAPYFILYH